MPKCKLDWHICPAGADIILLHGALHFCVAQRSNCRWDALVSVCQKAGGGILLTAWNCKSIDEAIAETEEWIRENIETILGTLRMS